MLSRIQGLKIRTRLFGIVGIVALGIAAVTVFSLSILEDQVFSERKEQTRRIVEVAHSVVQDYHRLAESGSLTQQEAQTQALIRLNALRYDGDQYFWVNDMDGVMLMHPTASHLIGTDLLSLRDAEGEIIFSDIIEIVDQHGAGHYEYYWPANENAQLKISYVMGFAEWGWVIGSGVFVTDVVEAYWAAALKVGSVAALLLLLSAAAAFVVARSISRPIDQLTSAMGRLAVKDLTVEIPEQSQNNEIGQMAEAVGVFKENLIHNDQMTAEAAREQEARNARAATIDRLTADFDVQVREMLNAVGSASAGIHDTANGLAGTAEETSAQATTVAAAAEQATGNVQTVASAAEELGSSISEINRQVQLQGQMADQAAEVAGDSAAQVQGLAAQAQKIGQVVDLITTIAEQTNLLALNATIEAARAGDAGKGFAVVASEVKSLANQTAKATEEIAGQIKAIQDQTATTVQAMGTINEKIAGVTEVSSAVAAAVEEQNAATQEIGRNVQQAAAGTQEVTSNIQGVNEAARGTGGAAADMLSASSALAHQAESLKATVQSFLAEVKAA